MSHRATLAGIFLALTSLAAHNQAISQTLDNFGYLEQVPSSGVVMDSAGALYGVTLIGSAYKLQPPTVRGGTWAESVLHYFPAFPGDGINPVFNLLPTTSGTFYGQASYGGAFNQGTIYALAPTSGGAWTETILHSFDTADGVYPSGNLAMDQSGDLYGTTSEGGAYVSYGVVFELIPPAAGETAWTEQVLHSFTYGVDGGTPSGIAIDAGGNLFGTTASGGGTCGCGTVWELSPPAQSGGAWTETVLYNFTEYGSNSSYDPRAGVTLAADGSLFGTASSGGVKSTCAGGCGAVFRLVRTTTGSWRYETLHNFTSYPDGASPDAPVSLDDAGNVYGVAVAGGTQAAGCNGGCGVVYKLTRPHDTSTPWIETIYASPGPPTGTAPQSSVTLGLADRKLYSTTAYGGSINRGTVFSLPLPAKDSPAFP